MFQLFNNSNEVERDKITEVIYAHYSYYRSYEVYEEILIRAGYEVENRDPILAKSLAWIVDPVILDSYSAVGQKKWFLEKQLLIKQREAELQSLPYLLNNYIQIYLTSCEDGDFNKFSDLLALLVREVLTYTNRHLISFF